MVEIKLVSLLVLCLFTSAVFLIYAICFDREEKANCLYLIIPVAKNTENIELITRGIVLRAAEYYSGINVILLDCGADGEQFTVFDKIAGEKIDYRIVKCDALTFVL